MQSSMLIYALPSISAIAIKLLMIWYGRKMIRSASVWLWVFLGGLFIINIFEFGLFFFPDNPDGAAAVLTLTLYYVGTVVSSTGYFAVSMQLAGRLDRFARALTIGIMLVGLVVLFIPGAAISGAKSIGYSVTRVPGPYYWIIQTIVVGCLVSSLVVLFLASVRGKDWASCRRATAMLLATAPTALCVLTVVALMQFGLKINATVIVSLTINILLGVLIYTEYESGIFRFLSFVPATQEFNLTYRVAKAAYSVNTSGLSHAMNQFEKALVLEALKKSKGNKTSAAKMLGVSRTTLRRKLSEVC